MIKYVPRGSNVLVRVKDQGKVRGVFMPQQSAEGKLFTIEAVGPEVTDLKPGDRVLLSGTKDATYFQLPTEKDLVVTDQKHVVAIVRQEES